MPRLSGFLKLATLALVWTGAVVSDAAATFIKKCVRTPAQGILVMRLCFSFSRACIALERRSLWVDRELQYFSR